MDKVGSVCSSLSPCFSEISDYGLFLFENLLDIFLVVFYMYIGILSILCMTEVHLYLILI